MKDELVENATAMHHQPSDFAKLICKLRWIGMEEEALRLALAVRCLPTEERWTISSGPFSTD
jgi:hypothetical protein